MVNRVALGALPGGGYGLRVSRPAFDVLNTGLSGKQLAFDSRWPTAARVHLEGSITCGASGNLTTYSSVGFGTTFGSIPPVLVLMDDGTGWRTTDWNYDGGAWDPIGRSIEACRISASGMSFWHPITGASRTYKYLVMRPLT